jgi:hypothetical protein
MKLKIANGIEALLQISSSGNIIVTFVSFTLHIFVA